MEELKDRELALEDKKQASVQPTWLWILPILLLFIGGKSNKLNVREIEAMSLEKKAKLLGRIKGYMDSEEQLVIHRAEMLLHIILKVKELMELPGLIGAETKYHTLSYTDRKRHMLMDISEFVDDEKREVIHKAIDLHMKASLMENKIRELQDLANTPLSIDQLDKYIDVFDPLLEGELKDKTKELRVLVGILKLVKSLSSKQKLDESDIFEIAKPFLSKEQGEQLNKMIQIFRAVSSIGEGSSSAGMTGPENPDSEEKEPIDTEVAPIEEI
ncbi:hypothetical protein [Alkaliphilus crotonatoxidans]